MAEPDAQFVATFTYSYQNGPDTMAHEPRHKIVTADTTVGEIVTWYRLHHEDYKNAKYPAGPITLMEAKP